MEQKNKPKPTPAQSGKNKIDADEAKEAFEKGQNRFAPPPSAAKPAPKGGAAAKPPAAPAPTVKPTAEKPAPTPPPAPEPEPAPAPVAAPAADSPYLAEHTVVAGDNLSMISQKYYGTQNHFMKIYQANKDVIGNDPNRIRAGQVLKIPKV